MSASTLSPDTLVTVKINVEGVNRKLKLPLRDLGPETLTTKLRTLLSIKPDDEAIFERYSDSTASFIVLDSNTPHVYKQLYRAAKAKLKLRLKVTIISRDGKPNPLRPYAYVEPEEPATSSEQSKSSTVCYPTDLARVDEVNKIGGPIEVTPSNSKPVLQTTEVQGQSVTLPIRVHSHSVVNGSSQPSEIKVSRGAAAREQWLKDLSANQVLQNSIDKTMTQAPVSQNSTVQRNEPQAQPFYDTFSALRKLGSLHSVYCNNCDMLIPNVHYHCSTCDDGDYDLCQSCVDQGITCPGSDHWLIKRTLADGNVVTSTTETITSKLDSRNNSKSTLIHTGIEVSRPGVMTANSLYAKVEEENYESTRTCNSCVQEFPENNFVTCTSCEDYDHCLTCHIGQEHGHHPKHAFAPAVEDMALDPIALALLSPGGNVNHQAICDGCDCLIKGVRHKCLDCPDWDFCSDCFTTSVVDHPTHRFVPIYEPLSGTYGVRSSCYSKARHIGVYCDGPLCRDTENSEYIRGDRYKCAVCDDIDFCANCEAHPRNTHNRTHPLIKFKTSIKDVSVTTTGSHLNRTMPVMGDRCIRSKTPSPMAALSHNSATKVQTIVDLIPEENIKPAVQDAATCTLTSVETILTGREATPELVAHFVKDTIEDGTLIKANTIFEQTWTLKNGGSVAWPAGCSVKFVGGDHMTTVDREHPASIEELLRAAESSTCQVAVEPGNQYNFSIKMRTPSRAGRCISYWRLTGPTGEKFGHRLWCDVDVSVGEADTCVKPEIESDIVGESSIENATLEVTSKLEESQLSFPKLEKESPQASIHKTATAPAEAITEFEADDLVDEEFDEETEDGFMTDEEWDVLDASDEEFLSTKNGKMSSH